jgi:hypothetical protein
MKRSSLKIKDKFNRLTVVSYYDTRKGYKRWLCNCDCGNQIVAVGAEIKRGTTKSCGCFVKECLSQRLTFDLKDKVFGGLTAIKRVNKIGSKGGARWECNCICSNKCIVLAHNLVSGKTTSCNNCNFIDKKKSIKTKRTHHTRPEGKTKEYSDWRTLVYKRDNYCCIACGKPGRLNAHHLNGWHWAINERYLVQNGVTLCAVKNGCHKKFHNIYGNKNNTIKQFKEFLLQYFNKDLNEIINE